MMHASESSNTRSCLGVLREHKIPEGGTCSTPEASVFMRGYMMEDDQEAGRSFL